MGPQIQWVVMFTVEIETHNLSTAKSLLVVGAVVVEGCASILVNFNAATEHLAESQNLCVTATGFTVRLVQEISSCCGNSMDVSDDVTVFGPVLEDMPLLWCESRRLCLARNFETGLALRL
jgi:hypothetical protein